MIYIIPTPVGNSQDITLRALDLFKNLNIFLCENTNTTKKLFAMYDITTAGKKFYHYTSHQNNQLDFFADLIKDNDIWMMSESGTPWLSDPSKELVRICREKDLKFEVLPGANALVPAIVGSDFDTSEFLFWWFLPLKKWRQTKLQYICESEYPIYIYESVHRIEKLFAELKKINYLGHICIHRELSKKFEQKLSGNVDEMVQYLANGTLVLKGEFVVWFSNHLQKKTKINKFDKLD